jgi:hypothetical protein
MLCFFMLVAIFHDLAMFFAAVHKVSTQRAASALAAADICITLPVQNAI